MPATMGREASEPARRGRVAPSADRILARLHELALLSDEDGRLTRLYLSAAHRRAVDRVSEWMREAGLHVRLDAAATLVGRLEADSSLKGEGTRTLILGSHLDTVRDAGRFDGMLGVLAAIEVVEVFARGGEALPFALEVAAFGDEEGVRFPNTLTGSRAMAGLVGDADLVATDEAGVTLSEALEAFGCGPSRIAEAARDAGEVMGYFELHIEQGPELEAAGHALGLVSGISGARRTRIVLSGTAGHAGTTPMEGREDALCCAAEIVLAVERRAARTPGLVATAGTLEIRGGGANVVPGHVTLGIDLRAFDDGRRKEAHDALMEECRAIASRRGVRMGEDVFYDTASVACDRDLTADLAEVLEARGTQTPLELASMAGHDGLAMARLCPIAMLFVRCRDGVSHSPEEHVERDDIAAAVAAICDFVDRMASRADPS